MKKYPLIRSRAGEAAFVFLLGAVLFLNRDTCFCMWYLGFYKAQFLSLGLMALLFGCFVWVNRKEAGSLLRDGRILFAVFCAAVCLVPMVMKRDWQLMYVNILVAMLFAVLLTFFVTYQKVAGIYVRTLAVLSVYSVITCYLLRIPADSGALVPPIVVRSDGIEFYNYFFSFVSISFVKNRNFGVFREPGVYQYFLMLGLYLNHYQVEWKKISHMWIVSGILAVTMLSTFATGGVIEMGLFVIVLYFDKKWYRTRQGRILAVSAVAAFLAACAFIVIQKGALYEELYLMLEKFGNGSDSITDRVGSPMVNAQLFLSSPLWGAGIAETLSAIENNTSSSTILFAILGVVGGVFHVAGWFALVWNKKSAVWANLALLLILAMSFNTQNLITDPYFWLFPMMAVTDRWLPLLKKRA